MEEYSPELLNVSNVIDLIPLYTNVFRLKMPPELVERKFLSEYQQVQSSYLMRYKSGKIVSFYGMICQKAEFNGEIFWVGQSCDSMTHKSHLGKGLFITLANKVYAKMKSEGVDFIYGFPNDNIYGLRKKKLGWQHNENIHYYKEKIKTLPLAKLVKKFPLLDGMYLTFVNRVLKKYRSKKNFFPNSVLSGHNGGIVHDEDYFKYKDSPNKFRIEINEVNFWIKIDGLLWVGDFESADRKTFIKALHTLKKIARQIGCLSILFHFHEGSANDILLGEVSHLEGKMPYGFLMLGEPHRNRKLKFCGADFDTW
jgi:hypothetical protein